MVRYRIVEGDTEGNFSIDSVTGEVSCSENSDWCCLLWLFSVSKAFDMNSNDCHMMMGHPCLVLIRRIDDDGRYQQSEVEISLIGEANWGP